MAKCTTCKGTGEVCDVCRFPVEDCTCPDGAEEVNCDLCDGTGDDDEDDDQGEGEGES